MDNEAKEEEEEKEEKQKEEEEENNSSLNYHQCLLQSYVISLLADPIMH